MCSVYISLRMICHAHTQDGKRKLEQEFLQITCEDVVPAKDNRPWHANEGSGLDP